MGISRVIFRKKLRLNYFLKPKAYFNLVEYLRRSLTSAKMVNS